MHDPLIKKVETVGKVQPHLTAKVVDTNGDIVPIGQPSNPGAVYGLKRGLHTIGTPGELCVSGYSVQKGYWNDPEQTAKVYYADPGDATGMMWMHTGDEAIMDEEGYLRSELAAYSQACRPDGVMVT